MFRRKKQMPKFKILPKIDGMRIRGTRYGPGSIVELPESYRGANYLLEVKEEVPLEAVVKPSLKEKKEAEHIRSVKKAKKEKEAEI